MINSLIRKKTAPAGGAAVSRPRWQFIDVLRGVAVCLMVFHHLFYDIWYFGFAPYTIFSNVIFDPLHYLFLGVFIALCGVSSRFSGSNLRRGLELLVCAGLVTLVTWLIGQPVWFGVLHFLCVAILLYALLGRLTDRLPVPWALAVCAVLFAASWVFIRTTALDWKILWFFGKTSVWNLSSADYVQLFPWLFVFFAGVAVGRILEKRTPPAPKKSRLAAFFSGVGRHSLIIYLLHQPVLYGVVWLAAMLAGKL